MYYLLKKKDTVSDKKEKSEEVVKLEADIEDLKNKLTRALADYQNLQKQTLQQVEAMRISSLGKILSSLLQVADDMEMATKSEKLDRNGLKNISEKTHKIITEEGCEVIKPKE